jgi:hypothetical protein
LLVREEVRLLYWHRGNCLCLATDVGHAIPEAEKIGFRH